MACALSEAAATRMVKAKIAEAKAETAVAVGPGSRSWPGKCGRRGTNKNVHRIPQTRWFRADLALSLGDSKTLDLSVSLGGTRESAAGGSEGRGGDHILHATGG